jgi:hypothetical protein
VFLLGIDVLQERAQSPIGDPDRLSDIRKFDCYAHKNDSEQELKPIAPFSRIA